jgi:FixJ family two-component response regulator
VAELRERYAALTARERQIMSLVATGRANKQIAAELDLSEMTVKVHRGQVMRKMQASSLPELVRMADRLAGGQSRVAGDLYPSRSVCRLASPEFAFSGG